MKNVIHHNLDFRPIELCKQGPSDLLLLSYDFKSSTYNSIVYWKSSFDVY